MPYVRQRLVENCGLICTRSDSSYFKDGKEGIGADPFTNTSEGVMRTDSHDMYCDFGRQYAFILKLVGRMQK